jgi:hypothetical protein
MGSLRGLIRSEQPFRESFTGRFVRRSDVSQRKAQSFHQLQRFVLISALIRGEPFAESVRNGFARKYVTAVKVGGDGKVRRATVCEFLFKQPDIRLIRAGYQSNRFLICLDIDGGIVAGGEPSPDVGEGLAQTVACLSIASPRPKYFRKQLATMAAATCQDHGGEQERRLARGEADGRAIRGRNV